MPKQYKICSSCSNFKNVRERYSGGFYNPSYRRGFSIGKFCTLGIFPKVNGSIEICLKYKSKSSNKRK